MRGIAQRYCVNGVTVQTVPALHLGHNLNVTAFSDGWVEGRSANSPRHHPHPGPHVSQPHGAALAPARHAHRRHQSLSAGQLVEQPLHPAQRAGVSCTRRCGTTCSRSSTNWMRRRRRRRPPSRSCASKTSASRSRRSPAAWTRLSFIPSPPSGSQRAAAAFMAWRRPPGAALRGPRRSREGAGRSRGSRYQMLPDRLPGGDCRQGHVPRYADRKGATIGHLANGHLPRLCTEQRPAAAAQQLSMRLSCPAPPSCRASPRWRRCRAPADPGRQRPRAAGAGAARCQRLLVQPATPPAWRHRHPAFLDHAQRWAAWGRQAWTGAAAPPETRSSVMSSGTKACAAALRPVAAKQVCAAARR
jgi:hypothetical protein